MATTTYEPIANQTLGSASANITFTDIPQTYTDLIVVFNGSSTGTAQYFMQVGNGSIDTGSNYSTTGMTGNGSSAVAIGYTNDTVGIRADLYATAGGNIKQTMFQIQNYSNTSTNKSILVRSALPASEAVACVGLWRSNSAINTLRLTTSSTFSAGATVSLYGIANAALGAPKATGGIITYDSTYFYHTFGASGTFTPQQSLTADVLVVAGGGGGGGFSSGQGAGAGGGAGGLCYQTGRSLTSGVGLTVTVGAGGNAGSGSANPTAGGNSTLGAITALGGGYGASHFSSGRTGGSGGSGGGASEWAGDWPGGTATQGNSDGATGYGSNGGANSNLGGGAGGGAGGTGGTASGNTGGAGGLGFTNSVITAMSSATGTGVSSKYAGGGGGGAGFSGSVASTGGTAEAGGGIGGNSSGGTPRAGIVNTGGGGGGAPSGTGAGTTGGSGVVIIRYLKA